MRDPAEFLHTSSAYQDAVRALLIREVHDIGRRLGIDEAVVASVGGGKEVHLPFYGVGGSIDTQNYQFTFAFGQLRSIRKRDWMQRADPPLNGYHDLIGRDSLLDTPGAASLAEKWLARLGATSQAISACPPRAAPARACRVNGAGESVGDKVPVPFFIIRFGMPAAATVQILGTTCELIGLEIERELLLQRPPLTIPNTAELLGPRRSPQELVAERLGGENYEIIEKPEQVSVWLLASDAERGERRARTAPKQLTGLQAEEFSKVFTEIGSYLCGAKKLCHPQFGVCLRFVRKGKHVDVSICYECDMIGIQDREELRVLDLSGAVHNQLVRGIQAVYPADPVVAGLKLYNE